MHRPQRRLERAQHVVRHQRHAEGEQCGLGITQGVDLAVERRLQLLERGLDRPAATVQIGDDLGAGVLGRHVGHQVELRVPVPRRLVQDHRDPPQEEDLTRVVGGPDRLLIDLAGLDPAARPPLADALPVECRGVLSDHEETAAPRDPEEEIGRAEVAVGDEEVLGRDDRQDPVQQRSLLGMTVFAQDDVGGQHQPGVEDDQRLAGQGPGADRPQLLEPVLGAGEMVAVEDPDAIAGQPLRPAAAHRVDDRSQPRGHRRDQRRRHGGLGAVELVVDGVDRGPDGLGPRLEGRVDRGPDAADDHAHQVDDRGEKELVGELLLRDVLEELIEDLGVQGVLDDPSRHDGQGGILGESLKDVAEDHRCRLRGELVTPYLAAA